METFEQPLTVKDLAIRGAITILVFLVVLALVEFCGPNTPPEINSPTEIEIIPDSE